MLGGIFEAAFELLNIGGSAVVSYRWYLR